MKIRFILLALIVFAMGACSNEEAVTNSNEKEGNAFLQLAIGMSSQATSRSLNAGDGTEVEENEEWTATTIQVILYNKSTKALVSSKTFSAENWKMTVGSNNTKTYILDKWMVQGGEYRMFAIVNPVSTTVPTYAQLTEKYGTDADFAAMTTPNKFTMTNATNGFIDAEPTQHNGYYNDGAVLVNIDGTSAYPTNATVNVERTVAKVMLVDKDGKTEYKYTPTGDGLENDRVVFQGYLKCNLNKKYYPVKHVIKSGITTNDYVVDPNFDLAASTAGYVIGNFSNIAFRPTALNILQSLQDNNKFYCLENTMKAEFQQIGQATLVVYQARYYVNCDDAGAVVSNAKHLYRQLGKVYTSFAQLKEAGVDITTLPSEKSYNSTDETNTNYSDAEIAQFAAKGITVYNGGVCYYVYKIKHVSSEVNNDVMEFAVVRNNVYKLKLNSVTGIGKGSNEDVKIPGTGEPTPENPDELDDTDSNLNVQVVILPWTIRNNDIIL